MCLSIVMFHQTHTLDTDRPYRRFGRGAFAGCSNLDTVDQLLGVAAGLVGRSLMYKYLTE